MHYMQNYTITMWQTEHVLEPPITAGKTLGFGNGWIIKIKAVLS